MENQLIATTQGTISVLTKGSGKPIVFLHGIQGTARTWEGVVPLIADEYRAIAPNLRGRSASFTPDRVEDYRLSAFAEDLHCVLEWVGEPAVVVAWSMGVSVTLELVRGRGTANLLGLVLISGTPYAGSEAVWFHGESVPQVAEEAMQRQKRLGLMEAAQPLAVAASWHHVKNADYRDLLMEIRIPTLVLHGTDDDQCPLAHGCLLSQRIPGARLDEWRETGHNPMAKDPQRLVSAIKGFIAPISFPGRKEFNR